MLTQSQAKQIYEDIIEMLDNPSNISIVVTFVNDKGEDKTQILM